MAEKINRDVVSAETIGDFGSMSTSSSKERVINFLQGLSKEGTSLWASVKTIAVESKVSEVYTRNVLSKLMSEGRIEIGQKNAKKYYRWTPPAPRKSKKTE